MQPGNDRFTAGANVDWEEPEVSAGPGSSPWMTRLRPLMAHPGRWAISGVYCDSTGSLLKRGALHTPPGRWEFTSRSRGLPKGRAYLFARYLGPVDQALPGEA